MTKCFLLVGHICFTKISCFYSDFPDTVHLHPSDPLIGQSKDSQNSKGNQKSDSKLGKDSSLEAGMLSMSKGTRNMHEKFCLRTIAYIVQTSQRQA